MLLSVYKHKGVDCSNGGLSVTNDDVLWANMPGFPLASGLGGIPGTGLPRVMLVAGNAPGTAKVVPAKWNGASKLWEPEEGWYMFGGCYVGTSDSRWVNAVRQLIGAYPLGLVPLHDRRER